MRSKNKNGVSSEGKRAHGQWRICVNCQVCLVLQTKKVIYPCKYEDVMSIISLSANSFS